MSDDWETAADDVGVQPPVVNQWEGEDAEDESVPDAWDADPEEKPKTSAAPAPEKKKAVTKRALQKKEEEERRIAEKQAAAQAADPNFAASERERLRRMEEDRDAALAGDLFGVESIKPREASSDLPGGKSASAAASSSVAASAASPASAAASGVIAPNALLKAGARLEEAVLDTDADVDKFCVELGKRFEKLGKSAMASKKILKLLSGCVEESIKLGVLRLDDVGELKRVVTVKHNDMTAKMKKGDKKKQSNQPAKPVVQLARNAFMHGDNFGIDNEPAYGDDDFM